MTYPQLFLQINAFSDGGNDLVSEIIVAAEVERLEFLELLQRLEDFAHALDIHDRVVFERHLHQILPFL